MNLVVAQPIRTCLPILVHFWNIYTNIRHITLELLLSVCLLLLYISDLCSVMPLINEDWLLNYIICTRLLDLNNSLQCITKFKHFFSLKNKLRRLTLLWAISIYYVSYQIVSSKCAPLEDIHACCSCLSQSCQWLSAVRQTKSATVPLETWQ